MFYGLELKDVIYIKNNNEKTIKKIVFGISSLGGCLGLLFNLHLGFWQNDGY